ncbi:uncharacterized protein EI90DRAFT_1261064 [Cantharellus anzutake]|uniref:uncharacterized protein n=1 Tax=Cantharellus anzutake TaxID=1750568 RepID=UPI00190386A6|nr:uncharacterized protein EI90DRAFT_1261064 [Cantharellus anzutake]KAF8330058.1 hypothetical protein EI90DRAFT_1261064 [Cantharellus anzutake]
MAKTVWVLEFTQRPVLGRNPWHGSIFSLVTVISSSLVHIFFIDRIRKMTKRPWLPLVILITALSTLGCGLEVAVSAITLRSGSVAHGYRGDVIGWWTSQAVTDMLIAGTMVVLLWRSRTGFRRTDRALTLMGIYAVNTGLVPCIMAIVIEIIFLSYKQTVHFIYLFFSTSLGGVYTFTLLANLNARNRMRSCLHPKEGEAIHQSLFLTGFLARRPDQFPRLRVVITLAIRISRCRCIKRL